MVNGVSDKREWVLYVEGGGDGNAALKGECRRAFSNLFVADGVQRKPGVVACGGRAMAFRRFCQAVESGSQDAWLLVDAESNAAPGPTFDPWAHVLKRKGDGWHRPKGVSDNQLHFMNVAMETWLVADPKAFRAVFGSKVDVARLSTAASGLESVDKTAVNKMLNDATRPTAAGSYAKGAHSFKLLMNVSPSSLRQLLWAKRFLDALHAGP